MGSCFHCGKKINLPFTCSFCGEKFCSEHHLPENHQCWGKMKSPEVMSAKYSKYKREIERDSREARIKRIRAARKEGTRKRKRYEEMYEIPGVMEVDRKVRPEDTPHIEYRVNDKNKENKKPKSKKPKKPWWKFY